MGHRFVVVPGRKSHIDARSMVVVSARPGLPIRVRDLEREPDEIDGSLAYCPR
jgi:hypothetical protein